MHITQFLVLRYSPSGLLLSFLSTEIPTVTSDTLTTLCPLMLCCTTLTFGKTRSLRQSSAASISSAQSISALSAPLSPSLHVLPNGCICLTPLAIRICSRNGVMLCASPLRFVLPVNLVQMRLLHVHRRVFFRWKHTHPLSLSLCAIDGYLDAEDPHKLNLRDKRYQLDKSPLVPGCECYACKHHTRAYVHHLLNTHEMLGAVLLTVYAF